MSFLIENQCRVSDTQVTGLLFYIGTDRTYSSREGRSGVAIHQRSVDGKRFSSKFLTHDIVDNLNFIVFEKLDMRMQSKHS